MKAKKINRNLKNNGIVLSLKDQLPVSRNEKVHVEVIVLSKEELSPQNRMGL
jgi:hypothetical protein